MCNRKGTRQCPFCGNPCPEIIVDENEYLAFRYYVWCDQCGGTCGRGRTKEEAIEKWNRRFVEDKQIGSRPTSIGKERYDG